MSLLDELKTESNFKPKPTSTCSVCKLIEGLTPAEADLLVARLADPEIPSAAISRVLIKNGYKIAGSTIGRHKRNECQRV
jgi:hypothetical protein